MDYFIFIKLFGIILLILGNAFFVGSEIALTSARRSRIHHLAQHGDAAAKIVQILHSEPKRFYSVTQIGITLMSLGLGAIGVSTLTTVLNPLINFIVAHVSAIIPPAVRPLCRQHNRPGGRLPFCFSPAYRRGRVSPESLCLQ